MSWGREGFWRYGSLVADGAEIEGEGRKGKRDEGEERREGSNKDASH